MVIVLITFHLVNVSNVQAIVTLIVTVLEICYVFNAVVVKMSQDVLGVLVVNTRVLIGISVSSCAVYSINFIITY